MAKTGNIYFGSIGGETFGEANEKVEGKKNCSCMISLETIRKKNRRRLSEVISG